MRTLLLESHPPHARMLGTLGPAIFALCLEFAGCAYEFHPLPTRETAFEPVEGPVWDSVPAPSRAREASEASALEAQSPAAAAGAAAPPPPTAAAPVLDPVAGAATTPAAPASPTEPPPVVGTAAPIDAESNAGAPDPTAATEGFVLQPFQFPLDNGRLTFPPAAQPPRSESPAFSWEGAPAGTRSFALVFRERSLDSVKWVLWDIPSSYTALPPGIRAVSTPTEVPGSSQAGAVSDGYAGPLLSGEYQFELWALDVDRLPRVRMRSAESIAFDIMPRHVIQVAPPVRVYYAESRR